MKVYIDDGIENVKMLMKAGRQDWAKRLMKKLELFAPPAEIEKKGGKKKI